LQEAVNCWKRLHIPKVLEEKFSRFREPLALL